MAEDTDPGKDATQAFQSRLTKLNGDAMQFATQLFDENFQLRGEKRTLKAEVEETKKKVPAEGSVILTPDKAKEYEAYQALGKVEDLDKRLKAHENLETEVAALKKKEVIREIADIHEFKASVLEDRDKAAGGLEFVIKTDDKKRKAAYVKDGDKEIPLNEYAETNWADYMPSLKVEQASSQLQPFNAHGPDPKPKSSNGKEAYEHSRNQFVASGKYGM